VQQITHPAQSGFGLSYNVCNPCSLLALCVHSIHCGWGKGYKGKMCLGGSTLMFVGWLARRWEGGSKARSLAVSDIRVVSSETSKGESVTVVVGWVRLQQSRHLTIDIPSSGGGRSYPVSPTSAPSRREVLAAWVTEQTSSCSLLRFSVKQTCR